MRLLHAASQREQLTTYRGVQHLQQLSELHLLMASLLGHMMACLASAETMAWACRLAWQKHSSCVRQLTASGMDKHSA